jgi:pimeloyl-ACP methyl ester carboxylesterase
MPARDVGERPPLVLVHGLSGSSRWWTPVLPHLRDRFRLHLVDVPPFRRSFRPPDAAAWLEVRLEADGLECPDLVGHSLGGLVAAQLAARRPERVRRLVLVAPAGIPFGRAFAGHAVPLARAVVEARRQAVVLLHGAARAGPSSLLRGGRYATSADVRAELASIRAPTLLVWGARDDLVPAWLAGEWARHIGGAQTALLDGAGHVPMWDAPEALADSVAGFLAEG